MANKRKNSNWIGIGIFILVVVISGFALKQEGYWNNPLAQFMNDGNPSERGGEMRGTPPEGARSDRDSAQQGNAEQVGGRPEGGNQQKISLASIQWEQLGNVLFNLWFLGAMSVLIILIARPIGYLIKKARHKPIPAY